MSQNNSGPMKPYTPGVFGGISTRVRLILRLMVDGRVNPLLKLIPFASGIYLLFPDLMPGPVDDALLIWLSTFLFVELCPPDVVAELEGQISPQAAGSVSPSQPAEEQFKEEDIIDAEIVQKEPPKD